MNLSQDYPLIEFCQMLDGTASDPTLAGIVVDWMDDHGLCQTHRPEIMADVCLMYARDKGACEGLTEGWTRCLQCGGSGTVTMEHFDRLPLTIRNPASPVPKPNIRQTQEACPVCLRGQMQQKMYPLLPTEFHQKVFAEWAGRCWGPEVQKKAMDPQLAAEAVQSLMFRPDYLRAIEEAMWRSSTLSIESLNRPFRSAAVRAMKRRTLDMLPKWTQRYIISDRDLLHEHRSEYINERLKAAGFFTRHVTKIRQWRDDENHANVYEQTVPMSVFVPEEPLSRSDLDDFIERISIGFGIPAHLLQAAAPAADPASAKPGA